MTKVIVIGGSEGIGKAIVAEFVKTGADTVIVARDQAKLNAAISDLKAFQKNPDQTFLTLSCDITDASQTKNSFETLMSDFGVPDVLINCAGLAKPGYVENLSLDDYHKMISVNYLGTVHVCHTVVPHMIKKGAGHIINTSSIAGFIGLFGYTGYCASKFAVMGFSEALKRELRPHGIRVSVLCPPNTRTPGLEKENQTKPSEVLAVEEKAKVLEPEEVALYLMKNLKRFLIVPTFEGRLSWFLSRWFPFVLSHFVDRK